MSDRANMMITKNDRPACKEAEWSHQRWVTWLSPCSLYLLGKTLEQRFGAAKGDGMTWKGLVDGVKAPTFLSALSLSVLPDLASSAEHRPGFHSNYPHSFNY